MKNGRRDQMRKNGKIPEVYHLPIVRDRDHIKEIIAADLVREMLEKKSLLVELIRQHKGIMLNIIHFLNHLISMKIKVIGDAKIVEIGISLHAHIAITARYKNHIKKEVEGKKKERVTIH